jgi:hypothetical protein
VNIEAKTADLKIDAGMVLIIQGVLWSDLSVADESATGASLMLV